MSYVLLVNVSQTELYIFMEFCDGGSLQEFAEQGLKEKMIRRYTKDLLEAVDNLHSRDIVHRNVKGTVFTFELVGPSPCSYF